jgi:hypothetical protein
LLVFPETRDLIINTTQLNPGLLDPKSCSAKYFSGFAADTGLASLVPTLDAVLAGTLPAR